MRLLAFVLFAFVLAPPAAVAQTDPEFLITPKVGVGPVKIRASVDEVKVLLGPEAGVTIDGSYTRYTWRTQGKGLLLVWVLKDSVIGVAIQRDNRYATEEGLRPGDPPDKVERVMGSPTAVDHQTDPQGRRFDVLKYEGIQFVVPRDPWDGVVDIVMQIIVTEGK